jgi:hypothetical protein
MGPVRGHLGLVRPSRRCTRGTRLIVQHSLGISARARRGPRGELARRAGRSATRGRRRRRGVADFIVRDGDGAIGGAQWRSPPPLALRYGVNVASTRHQRAHGLSLPIIQCLILSCAREGARCDQTDSPPISFSVWRSRIAGGRWSCRDGATGSSPIAPGRRSAPPTN